MKHHEHWELKPGQLRKEETLDSECRIEVRANKNRFTLINRYFISSRVVLLKTTEYPIPSDHPDFDESQGVDSHRWCVVVKPYTTEEEETQ